MCADCPQELRWRRRAAWPGCLQRTRIPRGSLRFVSRRREVFVPRNQRCGLLPTRSRRLLSPSAVGRLAAGEAAEVEEVVAAARVAAVGAVEGVGAVAGAAGRGGRGEGGGGGGGGGRGGGGGSARALGGWNAP